MCRKRQEQKEKEEMELTNVYQPPFTTKFKGHRNARTMVSVLIKNLRARLITRGRNLNSPCLLLPSGKDAFLAYKCKHELVEPGYTHKL